jgi:hypothetical protein
VPFPLKTEALGTPKIWIKLNNIHPANWGHYGKYTAQIAWDVVITVLTTPEAIFASRMALWCDECILFICSAYTCRARIHSYMHVHACTCRTTCTLKPIHTIGSILHACHWHANLHLGRRACFPLLRNSLLHSI